MSYDVSRCLHESCQVMAEADKSSLSDFKGKDCDFVTEWLKSKGLHELCFTFKGALESYVYIVKRVIWSLINFPGVRAFDHLKWTYNGAFERLFGSGREEFEH